MIWTVIYHPEVPNDLRRLGRVEAARIIAAIDKRIRRGEPDKMGKALRGNLAGCRRMRIGDTRIVYRVDAGAVEVLVVAVGRRRDDEIYRRARSRYRR
jgi:mRNA interferase RelE/StbE